MKGLFLLKKNVLGDLYFTVFYDTVKNYFICNLNKKNNFENLNITILIQYLILLKKCYHWHSCSHYLFHQIYMLFEHTKFTI